MLKALMLTIIIECVVLAILRERDKLFYFFWCVVTALTNLLINTYLVYLFHGGMAEYYLTILFLEIIVFLSEFALCFLYTKDKKKSIKYSLICNMSSLFIGLLISNFF